MAPKKKQSAKAAKADTYTPRVGPCRPVFDDEKEMRSFFTTFRESVTDDLKELAEARRRSEELVMRGFASR